MSRGNTESPNLKQEIYSHFSVPTQTTCFFFCQKKVNQVNFISLDNVETHTLTLHVPAAPDDVVQPNFVFPTQTYTLESVPLWRSQLLPKQSRKAVELSEITRDFRCTADPRFTNLIFALNCSQPKPIFPNEVYANCSSLRKNTHARVGIYFLK